MSSFPPLAAAARQAQALDDVAHRPWPVPAAQWSQAHTREDAVFLHWPADPAALARLLPPGLPLDTWGGEAWLGAVAFRLASARLRGLPALPRSFPQVELRTYVTVDGRPGVWPMSVETSNPLVAEAAKRTLRLPAYRARVTCADAGGGWARWEAARDGLALRSRVRAESEPFGAAPGTLEHFLVERYCLYTADGGRLYRAELHHAPWRLRHGRAEVEEATLLPLAVEGAPRVLAGAEQDVLAWALEEIETP